MGRGGEGAQTLTIRCFAGVHLRAPNHIFARPLVVGTLAQYKKTFDQMVATMEDMVTPNRESSASIDNRYVQ